MVCSGVKCMENHIIKSLYEVREGDTTKAIIFSTANNNSTMKYDYYILTLCKKKKYLINKIQNPISIARDSHYTIQKVSLRNKAYQHYISHFSEYNLGSPRI